MSTQLTSEAEHAGESRGPASAGSLRISSRRFGTIDVLSDQVLHFSHGLIGFPGVRRFVVLEHRPGSPFKWMLCLDDPDLAFAVAEPADLVRDYHPPLELAARLLSTDPADIGVFVIVTIPSDPLSMTVNLMAPIVVDLHSREARQLVLEDGRLGVAHRVICRPGGGAPAP